MVPILRKYNRIYLRLYAGLVCCAASSVGEAARLSGAAPSDTLSVQRMQEVEVMAAGARRNLNEPLLGRTTLNGRDIETIPMMLGEPDLIKALQIQPGVTQGIEGFTGLYVHGGENDQNQFLYHGLPLYHISHLGGVFSAFNVNTIQQADFYKSAFPARFGGSVSSVTDIAARRPNFEQLEGQVSVGLISGSAYVSAPIVRDRTAFSVGVRRSWLDVVGTPVLAIYNHSRRESGKKLIAGYALSDVNLRLDHRLSPRATAYVIGYWGADRLRIGDRKSDRETATTPVDSYEENANRLHWGNWGALLAANCAFTHGVANIAAFHTSYFSTYAQTVDFQTDTSDPLTEGYHHSTTGNGIHDTGGKATYDLSLANVYDLRTGITYTHHAYRPEQLTNESLSEGIVRTRSGADMRMGADEAAAYIDNTVSPWPWLSVNAGLRGVSYHIASRHYNRLEPRAALRIRCTRNVSLKTGYSRMNQFAQQVSNNYVGLPTDPWQPTAAYSPPLHSDHYTVGIYGNLPAHAYFSVEGWYRDMDGLVEYREGISSLNPAWPWYEKLTTGRGWAYGIDVSLTRTAGRVTGSIGYGLMWNWRKMPGLNQGERYPAKFDNRHKLNVNVSYRFSERMDLHVGWTYLTGNRLTFSLYNIDQPGKLFPDAPGNPYQDDYVADQFGLNYVEQRNNVRLPAYHRMDIGLNLHRRLRNSHLSTWNISLYNAYCHWNPLTIQKDFGNDYTFWAFGNAAVSMHSRRFKTLALLPVIPSVSYTYHL